MYCLQAEAIKYIERDEYTDMPKLFSDIAEAGHETYAMPMFEYWLDIGRHEDLKKFKNSALK